VIAQHPGGAEVDIAMYYADVRGSTQIAARMRPAEFAASGGNYQFAVLGDAMNFGARLVAAAKAGELIMSEQVWNTVASEIPANPRTLALKGYS
jgi:class 3 adenylate cyclase